MIDDILGPENKRPKIKYKEPYRTKMQTDIESVAQGVTIAWLVKHFRMGRPVIERKIRGCPSVGSTSRGNVLYDLPTVAAYLVKPKRQLEQIIAELKPSDLPEKLRDSYWAAMLKRQRWEKNAGHLWRTEKVLDVFSEVFKLLRTRLQLLPDDVDRAAGLSAEQRGIVTGVIDEIQDELHRSLNDLAALRSTPSQSAEIDPEDEEGEDDEV